MRKKSSPKGVDWVEALKPLFRKYGDKKHPLEYANRYQLVVMVVLSAQSTDRRVNEIAGELFRVFPSISRMAGAAPEDLYPYVNSVVGFRKKAQWLVSIARAVATDDRIPVMMDELTALPGIGRKSANVIIRESGGLAEGIIVDLHVERVAQRLGMAAGSTQGKIEEQLMKDIPQEYWNEAGMSFSFLGREICRPTNPHCEECDIDS